MPGLDANTLTLAGPSVARQKGCRTSGLFGTKTATRDPLRRLQGCKHVGRTLAAVCLEPASAPLAIASRLGAYSHMGGFPRGEGEGGQAFLRRLWVRRAESEADAYR